MPKKKTTARKKLSSKIQSAVEKSRFASRRGEPNWTAASEITGIPAQQIKKYYDSIKSGEVKSGRDKTVEKHLSARPSFKQKKSFLQKATRGIHSRTRSKKATAATLKTTRKRAEKFLSGDYKSEKAVDEALSLFDSTAEFFSGKKVMRKLSEKRKGKKNSVSQRYYELTPGYKMPKVGKKSLYQVIGKGNYNGAKKPIVTNMFTTAEGALIAFGKMLGDYQGIEIDDLQLRIITP